MRSRTRDRIARALPRHFTGLPHEQTTLEHCAHRWQRAEQMAGPTCRPQLRPGAGKLAEEVAGGVGLKGIWTGHKPFCKTRYSGHAPASVRDRSDTPQRSEESSG